MECMVPFLNNEWHNEVLNTTCVGACFLLWRYGSCQVCVQRHLTVLGRRRLRWRLTEKPSVSVTLMCSPTGTLECTADRPLQCRNALLSWTGETDCSFIPWRWQTEIDYHNKKRFMLAICPGPFAKPLYFSTLIVIHVLISLQTDHCVLLFSGEAGPL